MPYNTKENIVDQTMALIVSMVEPLQPANKELWKELLAVAFGQTGPDNRQLYRLIEYDSHFMVKLIELFDEQKSRGNFSSAFPSETAATVIFYNILTSYLFYLYNPEKTIKELTESIREQVQFILEGRGAEG